MSTVPAELPSPPDQMIFSCAVAPQCPQDSRAACQQAAESRDNAVLAGSCQVILMAAVCCSYYSELYGLTVSHAKPVINTE